MMHPATELRSAGVPIGLGVFATDFIPRGTVVWVHDPLDRVFDEPGLAALPPILRAQVDRYGHRDGDGRRVLCWDHARFMNHACDPTTTSVGTLMEIARRDLHPGDELTCEYGLDYVSEAFDCRCRSPACRGTLVPADPTAQRRRWDRESQEAFDHALTVDQPALAAAASVGPGAAIVAAILARRPMRLPSWLDGTPGSAVGQPRRS